MRHPAILAILLASFASSLAAQDWARFRGANGAGQSDATGIPAKWTDADYNWKIDLPGIGHSSPVVWKDRIYLMSADPKSGTRYVMAISAADGKPAWTREFPGEPHPLHVLNSFASCTPAVDADHVYVAWSDPQKTILKALNHAGNDVWEIDMGPWVSQHGFGCSPMLVDDLVVIMKSQEDNKRNDGQTPGESFVLAVDRKTGKERWKLPRGTASNTASYSTPCIRELPGGKKEIVCCTTTEGIFAIDPQTGKENWATPIFTLRPVSSPLLFGDLVFGSCGSGGGGNYVTAIKAGAKSEEVWRVKEQAPYVPTPVAYKDALFLWFENGIVTCVDAATGKQHWQQRIGGKFWGSPIRVADKIYCIGEGGDVMVIAADTKAYKLLGKMPLGDVSHSTPAVSGGRMYLRTGSKLFSLGGKST
jgi:outer membrane protein assembly factor BamB